MKLFAPVSVSAPAPASAPTPSETVAESVPAGKPETCQPPTSPSLTQQSLSHPSLLDAKDRRAYEVARQRAKRPEDRRKARNQKKAKHGWLAGVTGRGIRGGGDAQERDVEDAAVVDTVEVKKEVAVRECQSKPEPVVGVAGPRTDGVQVTVRLEDLIRVSKVRKEKAGDFEVIPHVRAVIALDESDFAACDSMAEGIKKPEIDFVDDWEHIYSDASSSSEEDEPRTAPSYAQVVSKKQD